MDWDWHKLSEETVWSGYRQIVTRHFRKPDGAYADFEIKKEGEAVCIMAITDNQTVLLTKEFRPGPEIVLLELPGGFKAPEEDAEEAARRELLEETGYTGDFSFVGTSLADAYSDMVRYNFVARNCHKVQEQATEENEHIEVVQMTIIEFRSHLRSGQLTDVATGYLGLDFLGLL
ncbi:NUDIX hydrolase [Patescibacteria group bacterium]|nr:NUDIX hydrolase [Patescibacteria group bacterium]